MPIHRTSGERSSAIVFQPEGRRLAASVDSTILDAARSAGLDIQAPCGDLGLCGRCRVVVKKGEDLLTPPTEAETTVLSPSELGDGYRLACQSVVSKPGVIVVTVPAASRIGHQRMVVQGFTPSFKVSPVVVKTVVKPRRREGVADAGADSDILLSVLEKQGYSAVSFSLEALRRLPEALREGEWVVTAVLWGGCEVLSLEPGDTSDKLFGFAVDVGTTKLAGYLLDLKSGETLTTASLPNPQISFGEDLISRVTYWSESEEKSRTLQQAVIDGVNTMVNDACRRAGIKPREIYDVTVAGNTVMHHIFFGISPKHVALSPFPVAVKKSFDARAGDLKLAVNQSAYVHALPPIAGFVGADTVAGILATEIYKSGETSLLIDIGTNAEIVVGDRDRLTCCSSPAGPAFEGGHIKHGMRASTGAIESIWIDPKDYSVGYKTVDDAKPVGLCGSGIIDAVAHLLKTGVINRRGRFNAGIDTPRLQIVDGETEFVLAWRKETAGQEDITLTSHDLQEVLLAKAAVYTGASLLLKRLNLQSEDVKRLYVAGAFGTYVDVRSSLIIGLYPEVPVSRVSFVGNTSGSGARMALLSGEVRRLADKIAEETQYLELSTDPLFEGEFTKALWLPHREDARFPTVMDMLSGSIK